MDYEITGYSSGHPIYLNDKGEWLYQDTNELVTTESMATKPCTKCHIKPTTDGHDACIANLPGVQYACCGHGIEGHDYVKVNDGRRLSLDEYYKEFKK